MYFNIFKLYFWTFYLFNKIIVIHILLITKSGVNLSELYAIGWASGRMDGIWPEKVVLQ